MCLWTRIIFVNKRPYKVEKEWKVDNFKNNPVVFLEKFYKTEVVITVNEKRDKFILGLLSINVSQRLGSSNNGLGAEEDIKPHTWLHEIDWSVVEQKGMKPSYKPNVWDLLI